jgi:hypothetical protein
MMRNPDGRVVDAWSIDGELSQNEERQADPGSKKACEPVRDDDWSPDNREPACDAEICKWSAQEYDA